MARGIIILGSAGSDRPFTVMNTRDEKINRLMTTISKGSYFLMAGSIDSFNAPCVPLFDLAVHITVSAETRIVRIQKRESELFGERIEKGAL